MSEQRPVLSVFNQSNNDLGSGLLSAPNEGSNSISRMSSLASNALSRQNSTQSDYSYADYSDDETGEIDENMPTVIPCNREKKGFAGPKIDFNRPYTVSPESVIDLIAQDVNIIAEFCCIPTPLALMVLYTFGFDKDLVQSKFMEADDGGDALIQHLKINRIPSEYTVESVPEWGCMICQEEENVEFLSFGCGHVFCKNCYTRYCTEKLNGNDVFNIRCMQPGCNIMPSKDTLKQLLGDSTGKEYEDGATAEGATAETEVTSKGGGGTSPREKTLMDKYIIFMSNVIINNKNDICHCPKAGCGEIVFIPAAFLEPSIDCMGCHHKFCGSCSHEAHAPASCAQLEMWNKKDETDGKSEVWILLNTKACPKCKAPIFRTAGCDHMTCSSCRWEFCWLCHAERRGYSGHTCNKVPESVLKDPDTARRELQIYHHYWDRFTKHNQSLEKANDVRKDMEKKAEEIEANSCMGPSSPRKFEISSSSSVGSSSSSGTTGNGLSMNAVINAVDAEYLLKAYDALIRCRRTLKYTYVYAYYMKDKKAKDLFENMQGEFEQNTNVLNALLEKEPESRIKIIDQMTLSLTRQGQIESYDFNDVYAF